MQDLERRARADWTQIQATGKDLEALADTLSLGREDLETQLEPLKLSVEGGCIEYKHAVLNSAFRELENERYKSLDASSLRNIASQLAIMVYVAVIQRLLADGQLPLRDYQSRTVDEEPASVAGSQTDVKDIISDVQQRVKDDPGLRTNQQIKNILMQLSRYSKELNDFRELTARIPKEKAAAVGANFRKTTDEIYSSIRKNYEQFLAAEQAAMPQQPQNILLRIDLKSMVPTYVRQARETARVRSTIEYAIEEKSGTRELLIEIADSAGDFQKLVDEETARYLELGGTPSVASEISRAMNSEIGKRIQREIEYF